ncbi:MAG: hypothetical protein ACI81T_002543 [Bacteroidia bacterium]|jgi:hypothetical protein
MEGFTNLDVRFQANCFRTNQVFFFIHESDLKSSNFQNVKITTDFY